MTTTTTIIGICIFVLSIAPIIFITYRSNRKRLRLKAKFDELVSKNNLQLTDLEDIDGKLIGFDVSKKIFLFVSSRIPDGVVIDLNKQVTSEVLRNKEVSQLDLRFKVRDDNKNEFHVPFFDSDKDDLLRFDYFDQKANKWLALINKSA